MPFFFSVSQRPSGEDPGCVAPNRMSAHSAAVRLTKALQPDAGAMALYNDIPDAEALDSAQATLSGTGHWGSLGHSRPIKSQLIEAGKNAKTPKRRPKADR